MYTFWWPTIPSLTPCYASSSEQRSFVLGLVKSSIQSAYSDCLNNEQVTISYLFMCKSRAFRRKLWEDGDCKCPMNWALPHLIWPLTTSQPNSFPFCLFIPLLLLAPVIGQAHCHAGLLPTLFSVECSAILLHGLFTHSFGTLLKWLLFKETFADHSLFLLFLPPPQLASKLSLWFFFFYHRTDHYLKWSISTYYRSH